MGNAALPPTGSRDQFFEIEIILIIFLGYWSGGGCGGRSDPATDSRDQFHNLRKKLSDGKKPDFVENLSSGVLSPGILSYWNSVVRGFCRWEF